MEIYFGAMADPLMQQIEEQGLPVPPVEVIGHLQRDADAISRLAIRGLIPPLVAKQSRTKLMRNIRKAVEARATGDAPADPNREGE